MSDGYGDFVWFLIWRGNNEVPDGHGPWPAMCERSQQIWIDLVRRIGGGWEGRGRPESHCWIDLLGEWRGGWRLFWFASENEWAGWLAGWLGCSELGIINTLPAIHQLPEGATGVSE